MNVTKTKMEVEYRIGSAKPLFIAGIEKRYKFADLSQIPDQWNKFSPHFGKIPGQVGDVAYGVSNELDVISAAVIGGTSFSGGVGTIPGAILGAVVMQSLRSGMLLLNVDSPVQDIVVGIVLVGAVGLDSFLRRRSST